MAITIEHRVYTKGDKTALLSIAENTVLTIINDESKLCESAQEAHLKLLTLGYKKTDTIIENAPVAPVPDKKYIKGTPEHKANKESKKKFKTEEAELDEATSPTAGTRLVKKYGEDAHRAEVRYNPDYQEYQVHHYKDGKHMGEGPVSYHGDDKQDAHDTAKSEVAKRSTVKEDLNEESHESLKKMSNYHYHEADYHAKKAGELENNNPKKVRHIEASNRHGAAAIHYDKASTAARRDHTEKQDYHTAHAEEYADAAEEHERTHNLMETLEEAHKLGDRVMIHKGSMAGTKGTIGEIRDGMFKGAPKTYTVDYSEPGKESRQSVQVKKEHIKALKEDTLDEVSKELAGKYVAKVISSQKGKPDYKALPKKRQQGVDAAFERMKEDTDQLDELSKATLKSYLEKGIVKGMKDAREGKGDISKKREAGLNKAMSKVYTKENLNEDQKDSVTMDIPFLIRVLELVRENVKDDASLHRIVEKLIEIRDRGTLTMDDYNYVASLKEELEISEEQMNELKKTTLASYTQKAAGSMANAAFGQGQASASYKAPQEKDTKLFSKRLKGIGTATSKLAKENLDESAADKYWDKAEEHKAEANKNKSNPEKFHNQMSLHHDALANYHSDIGQSNMAERHSKKAEEHHEKSLQASEKGLAEAVIDPEDKRNPDIPTYLRKKQGQKPLSYAEIKARSTKNVDAYHKRAGINQTNEDNDPCWDGYKMVGTKAKNGKKVPNCVKEEFIHELQLVTEGTSTSITLVDGTIANITVKDANILNQLYQALSEENQAQLSEYATQSVEQLSKMIEWANNN